MVLEADPAGLGYLPMGCLDHPGYTMSDSEDFYRHMILEVVTNKANSSTLAYHDLVPLANKTPRLAARTFNPTFKKAINQQKCMNVMYSKAKNARGKVSRGVELYLKNSDHTFNEVRSNWEDKKVYPKLIAVPLPDPDEAPFVWIDMSWPIRAIYLPVAQNPHDSMRPHCAYVQLKFTRLGGVIATSGYAEDGDQKLFAQFDVDEKYGLTWNVTAASMRVDIQKMYGTLMLPRERREIDNAFECLQLQHWTSVPYDPSSRDPKLNYQLGPEGWQERCISDEGLPLDQFLSKLHAVGLQYVPKAPSKIVAMVDNVIQFGLGFVPIIGPLLAFLSSTIITAMDEEVEYSTKRKIIEKFGEHSAKPIMESIVNYRKYLKKNSFFAAAVGVVVVAGSEAFFSASNIGGGVSMPLFRISHVAGSENDAAFGDEEVDIFAEKEYSDLMPMFADEVNEFQRHPEAFICATPSEPTVFEEIPEDQRLAKVDPGSLVVEEDPEAAEDEGAEECGHDVAAPAGA